MQLDQSPFHLLLTLLHYRDLHNYKQNDEDTTLYSVYVLRGLRKTTSPLSPSDVGKQTC